ncbi:MAG: tetratricopeptide repeat protein [Desulfatibacillum sp.]|nr:tetratricopeptide repeat protein [Desulfatibacillum sp.]
MRIANPSQVSCAQWVLAVALIGCAVLGIYAQSLGFDFIDLDDGVYVTQNPRVQAGLTADSLRWAFQTLHGGFWIPATWLSFMADQSLFGGDAWGFHLTNLFLHGANSFLVLWVFFLFTRNFRPSLVAALLFAVHPLHVESVAWVSERKDVLYAFFFLIAMGAHGKYFQTGKKFWAGVILGAGTLSLAAKPMAVSLPAVLLLLDFWPLGRFKQEGWRPVWEKTPLIGLCLVFGLLTLYAQNLYQGIQGLEQFPLGARLGNAVYSYGVYVWKSLWPVGLGVFYPHPGLNIEAAKAVAAGLFFAVTCSLAWRARQKAPWFTVGWWLFIITLLPVMGLVQSGIQGMADRFMYLPVLGLIMVVVWAGAWLWERKPLWEKPMTGMACASIILLSGLSVVQAGYWKNSISLYTHTLDVTENNYMVHEFLGSSLAARGYNKEAVREYEKALAINPFHGDALYGLGCVAVNQGRFEEGAGRFKAALAVQPSHIEALYGLATAQMHLGRVKEAQLNLEKVLSKNPGHAAAQKNLHLLVAREYGRRTD